MSISILTTQSLALAPEAVLENDSPSGTFAAHKLTVTDSSLAVAGGRAKLVQGATTESPIVIRVASPTEIIVEELVQTFTSAALVTFYGRTNTPSPTGQTLVKNATGILVNGSKYKAERDINKIADDLKAIWIAFNLLLLNYVDKATGLLTSTTLTLKDDAGSGSAGDRSIILKLTNTISKRIRWVNSPGVFRLDDQASVLQRLKLGNAAADDEAVPRLQMDAAIALATPFKNYFGTGADGALSTSGSISHTSTIDGPPVVKNYQNLTINVGHTMTVTNRCKGLILYVDGDLVINGTLTMTARGANAGGQGFDIKRYQKGSIVGDSTVISEEASQVSSALATFNLPTSGASGGSATSAGIGANGSAGTAGQTGGGGAGGSDFDQNTLSGAGGAGTTFSGGTGGGGSGITGTGGNGGVNGGGGGVGGFWATDDRNGGGGAGNPGGTATSSGSPGNNGTGGLIVLVVKGNVTIGASGIISANGANGGDGGRESGGGGGSGGGSILILHAGTYTNNGSIQANGGIGGVGGSQDANLGFAGGNGGTGSLVIGTIAGDKI